MNHLGTKEIETERFLLRRFMIDDAGFAFNNWMNSDDVCHYLSCPSLKEIKSAENILKDWIESYCKFEGRLRQASKNNTGVCDYAVYSILAEDYFKNN